MSVFNDINRQKLDSFAQFMQSDMSLPYQPSVTHEIALGLNSNDTTTKAIACAKFLVQWQNNLIKRTENPDAEIFADDTQLGSFTTSQHSLNKLKRKFSRMLITDMTDFHQKIIAKQACKKLWPPAYLKKMSKTINIKETVYLFENHGDNTLCLEIISEHANCLLEKSTLPFKSRYTLQGYLKGGNDEDYPDLALIHSLVSTIEEFPLATNTWGYLGQESSDFTKYTRKKFEIAESHLKSSYFKNLQALEATTPWEKAVRQSDFKKYIQLSKLNNGNPVGNCSERGRRIFHRIAREREFDCVCLGSVRGGDHEFVLALPADKKKWHVLDAWNGARAYPGEKIETYLYDYAGIIDANTGEPLLKKFDPKNQSLETLVCNIYPLKAFEHLSKTKYPQLIQLLSTFHAIPNSKRKGKMIQALKIIRFIENKMPLYEYKDPAVHELYDQMIYLTKKERKKGLKLPPESDLDRCIVNEALNNLDLTALSNHLKSKAKMDGLTVLHALKASLRANDITFLKKVLEVAPPIESSLLTSLFNPNPVKAIMELATDLTWLANIRAKKEERLNLASLCNQALS